MHIETVGDQMSDLPLCSCLVQSIPLCESQEKNLRLHSIAYSINALAVMCLSVHYDIPPA